MMLKHVSVEDFEDEEQEEKSQDYDKEPIR